MNTVKISSPVPVNFEFEYNNASKNLMASENAWFDHAGAGQSNEQTVDHQHQSSNQTNKMLIWQYCQASFRPSKTDLLSDYVDPAEERHMELRPDDATSVAMKKQHRRQNSDLTDITEEITDFSFLEECFDIPLMSCGDLEDTTTDGVVKMLFD